MDKSVILLGYFPLAYPSTMYKPGSMIDLSVNSRDKALKKMIKQYDKKHTGDIKGCLWVCYNGDKPHATIGLVIDNAVGVYNHLKAWTEDDISGWFEIIIEDNDEKYCVLLAPKIERSINRWKAAHLHANEQFVNTDDKVTIVCKPLTMWSPLTDTYKIAKGLLPAYGGDINVSIYDTKTLKRLHTAGSLDSMDSVEKFDIGMIKRGKPDTFSNQVNGLLGNTVE